MQYSAIFIQISSQSTNKIYTCVFIYLCVQSISPNSYITILIRAHTLFTHTPIQHTNSIQITTNYPLYRINDLSTLRLINTFVSLHIYMCVYVSVCLNTYLLFHITFTHNNTITHNNKNTLTFQFCRSSMIMTHRQYG